MTSRTEPAPATTEQVQQLPQDLQPYAQALLLAYLASGGEENTNTARRANLFGKALAASALAAFALSAGQKKKLNAIAAAKPFAEEAKNAAIQYRKNHPDADQEMTKRFAASAADTLSTGASNRTTLEVLKTLDPDGSVYKKLWLTRGDEKVRMSHRRLHGKTASAGDDFKTGLGYPGDPRAELDERINCRCFLWAVPASEDVATAHAFEPADFDMAFAASAGIAALQGANTLRKLMRLAPWTWQPRDSIGRWVEVGDVVYAPASSGKGRERGRVSEIVGRNHIRLDSLRFPGRQWEVDSRETFADRSKANLPNLGLPEGAEKPKKGFTPDLPPVVPSLPNRPPIREVRPGIQKLGDEIAGTPLFSADELKPHQIVVLESKSRPGQFRHMRVEEVDVETGKALLSFPPEPRLKAGNDLTGPDAVRIFQLENANTLQEVNIEDNLLYEPRDAALAQEAEDRFDSARFGFANPYWFKGTDDAFKTGADRTDWVPERKQLHDKIIADTFDQALPAQGPVKFYMMGGGPSSGKSTMLMADAVDVPMGDGGIQINADDIKTFLPEYVGLLEADEQGAAAFTHKESSEISSRMIREAPEDRHVVLDGVGDKGAAAVLARLVTARERDQRIVANYATLPTDMAVRLSKSRGEQTGRYVPETYIRRAHADVTDTFFDLAKWGAIDEMYLWNTELWDEERKVGIPRAIFSQVDGVSTIHDEALLLEFLNKSRSKRHSLKSVQALTQSGFEFPPMPSLEEMEELAYPPDSESAPVGIAAAGGEEAWIGDTLDWDTLENVLIEVAAELRGANFTSSFDDPTITALKEELKSEFSDSSRQIDVISNP